MENNKKKNKWLIVLVILLILCVTGLAGFIVSDKVFVNYKFNNNSTTTTTNSITNEKKSVDLNQEWNQISNNLETLKENDQVDFQYEFGCKNTMDNECLEETLTINNKSYELSPTSSVLYNDKIIIIKDDGGAGFQGTMRLVDYNGEEVFNAEYIGTLCPISGDSECIYFGIRGNNEKIYYIDKQDNYLLKAIDLNDNYNIIEINSINGYQVAG